MEIQKSKMENISKTMVSGASEQLPELVWNALLAFEGCPFQTAKGLQFYYSIKGNEIFFSRKAKSVTKATVMLALKNALELQEKGIAITGPKMLHCFGASYLYPIFVRIGIIWMRQ